MSAYYAKKLKFQMKIIIYMIFYLSKMYKSIFSFPNEDFKTNLIKIYLYKINSVFTYFVRIDLFCIYLIY